MAEVVPATSGRASCKRCLSKIGEGELRVGVQAYVAGRVVTVWLHPPCFLSECSWDRATARALLA